MVHVQNYVFAVSRVASTSLRSGIGHSAMDEILSAREQANTHRREIIDAPTEGLWRVKIERVEVKDVSLPESMKRSMSRQAEAERERRARVIVADGEFQASTRLALTARRCPPTRPRFSCGCFRPWSRSPRKNSTLIVPFPVELLHFLDAQSRVATRTADRVASEDVPLHSRPIPQRGAGDPTPARLP